MTYSYNKVLLFAILAIFFWSCQEDDEALAPAEPVGELAPQNELRDTTFKIMQEWYLWNQEMPNVNPEDYATADALMDDLQFDLDKWSYITTEEEYDSYFSAGEYRGYGYGPAFDENDQLRVSLVYNDSPFGRANVERGWIINKINSTSVSRNTYSNSLLEAETNTFEFINSAGETVIETLTKSTIAINTVLHHEIIQVNDQPVGYLAFNSFIANSVDELKPVFEAFQQANITDLILDLRYNGGGRVNVAEYMAGNMIGGQGAERTFLQYAYNADIQRLIDANPEDKASTMVSFEQPEYPLNLDRLVVIASERTASASELLINGLNPFMDVYIVGENTHGKPVGSFPFRYGGYAISPISFKIVNDSGEGEYFEGFKPDALVPDDLSRPFGDPQEARLQEALFFIETGTFSNLNARVLPTRKPNVTYQGFQQEIGAL